jgi:photosystem II stability/assembly factor-like uncharacterized protein
VTGAIQFLDDRIGWMVGANGEVLATTDGGQNWSLIHAGSPAAVAIDFVDPQRGWALTEEGGLIRTTDGGASWEDLGPPALHTFQFLTPAVGWGVEMIAQYHQGLGPLVSTRDGGETWDRQSIEVNSVCMAADGLGWAAGPAEAGLALFKTENAGADWTETGVSTPGGDTGWTATVRCAGIDAWVLGTSDAAAGHVAYAVWRTAEGGPAPDPVLQESTTHPLGEGLGIPEGTNPYPGPLLAFDGEHAGIVTWCPQCGGDQAFASFERSHDGGTTWTHHVIVGSDRPAEPLGASFVDSNHGWVLFHDFATDSRVVLTTTDGGQTWVEP